MTQFPSNPARLESGAPNVATQRQQAPQAPQTAVTETVQAPGMETVPPVSPGAQLFDQLSRSLGLAGQVAGQVGHMAARRSARQRREDREAERFERGQAVFNVRETLPGIEQAIANDEIVTPDGVEVSEFANQIIDERIPEGVSEAFADEWRSRMIGPTTRALTEQNQRAINANREVLLQRAKDGVTGVKNTGALTDTAEALQSSLGLNEAEARAQVGLHAMQYAADNADDEAFETAAGFLGDQFQEEQATARARFQQVREQNQRRQRERVNQQVQEIAADQPPVDVFEQRISDLPMSDAERTRARDNYARHRIEAAAALGDAGAVNGFAEHLSDTDANRAFAAQHREAARDNRSNEIRVDLLERLQFGELTPAELDRELAETRPELRPDHRANVLNAAPQIDQNNARRREVEAVQGGAGLLLTPDHDNALDAMLREPTLPVRDEGGNVTTDEQGRPMTQPAIGPGAQINDPGSLAGMLMQHVNAGGSVPQGTAGTIYSNLTSNRPDAVMAGARVVAAMHTSDSPAGRAALTELESEADPATRAAIGEIRSFADRGLMGDAAAQSEIVNSVTSTIAATREDPQVTQEQISAVAGDLEPDQWLGEVLEAARPVWLDPTFFSRFSFEGRPFGLRTPEIETLPIVEQQALQVAAEHYRVASRTRSPSIAREEAAERARTFVTRNTDVIAWPSADGRQRHVRVPIGGPDRNRLPEQLRWTGDTLDKARVELRQLSSEQGLEHVTREQREGRAEPQERRVVVRSTDLADLDLGELQPEADPLGRGWRFRHLGVDPMGEGDHDYLQVQVYDAETGERLGAEPFIWQPPEGAIERRPVEGAAHRIPGVGGPGAAIRPGRGRRHETVIVPPEELAEREAAALEEAAREHDERQEREARRHQRIHDISDPRSRATSPRR